MSNTDMELLARYVRQHAEDAFAEIVRRHVGLIYSAALRQVRSPQLAEEVAQSAFIDLARSAPRLKADTIVAAWLYQVTRRTAIDVVRREASRQSREQIATEMRVTNAAGADWTQIEPLLDEAMEALDAADRAAVLLRYFESKSLREVGQALGTSDDTAQKRVSRAVERLREFFAKRGVAIGPSGLSVVLSAHAVQAVPVGLAATVSAAAALAGTALAVTATHSITMITLPKALVATALAVAVGAPLYLQHRTIRNLRAEKAAAPAQASVTQATSGSPDQTPMVADAERLRREHEELLRLRGEVSRLRREVANFASQRPPPVVPPAPPQADEPPLEPVQIFVANADASVPAGQTMVFGGWATSPGARTLVLLRPRITDPGGAGRVGSILLESRIVEIPEKALSGIISELHLPGLATPAPGGKASSAHSLFTADDAALLAKALENTPGVNLVSAPRIETANGRQAVVSVTENQMIGGAEYVLGPSLDVEPRIAADGASVNLTVFARLRKATAPSPVLP